MQSMQSCCSGRWHPSTVCSSFRMHCFCFIHIQHFIRHWPHPLPYLCFSFESSFQSSIYIPIFISSYPWLLFHFRFLNKWSSLHACMNFIASSIQKASIDKYHSVFRNLDAFFQVNRRSSFFIHDAYFYC